ncbi:glycosyltransferase family 4 protein [Denitrobaculum tricleocarpae]|uniref:Glycosyltransferase family 4 protein n=1 Tax=Denitrobaculum tricleocarpae TaxID=2591009 RepID=A0A545TGI6_9PROT|nr:glycosyltransferase family 4 protein [Denitrobaculum tricleocarpae]TQV76241.1 glycosyltransferase family 4 protein [Denitrobaculum tricleocarpae]
MKILTFSTLFPNKAQPHHGVFVENRLRHLMENNEVTARVVAPVPWFPSTSSLFGDYATFAKVPRSDNRSGLDVIYPRYPLIPKVGMNLTPSLMYRAVKPVVAGILRDGFDFDLIDAHYFYPDGVAAAYLARALRKPLTITARGTDLNLIPNYPTPRRLIIEAAEQADGLITVCQALKDELVKMGIADQRVEVLRNGVDLELFQPRDRDAAKQKFGVSGKVLLSVGHLIERKGHHLIIEAMPQIPDATLLIAGTGPDNAELWALAGSLGLTDRVRFLGAIPHQEMSELYSAADVLVLASSREGWANVLLETMASGTPAAATNVWGAPEVITDPAAGALIPERTPDAIARMVLRVLKDPPSREATRAHAELFSWQATSQGQYDLFQSILGRR